jgi:hypothetical protein
VLAADTALEIETHFESHITSHSVLCSDGAWPYVKTAEHKSCDHKRLINAKNKEIGNIYPAERKSRGLAPVLDSVNWAFFQFMLFIIWNFREIHIRYTS